MMFNEKPVLDGTYSPVIRCRWNSYRTYKLILCAWMMNEVSMIFTPTNISHTGFYAHIFLQSLAVIFVGMPLVYTEICLAQYTNCNIFTMWDYFPLFRNVGYGTFYLIILKTLYVLVLASWYLLYVFYSALDIPPWFSCNDFPNCKCMVKRVNVSMFQRCLEAQILFNANCEINTASKCFFEREIGDNCTGKSLGCFYPWKILTAVLLICGTVYILSIKKEKFIQIVVKLEIFYLCFVALVLFCVSMSTKGTWYSSKIQTQWSNYDFHTSVQSINRGFLSLGTGYGIIIFLSRDVSFRSPATMTSVRTSLFSVFISFMFGLIAFSGIKSMSYYHGEEENIIESSDNIFFLSFASMTEILTYFDGKSIWGLFWFSVIFFNLYVNFWILYLFLKELVLDGEVARKYSKSACLVLMTIIICASLSFMCSDLTVVLTSATEIIQIFQNLLLSFSMYWMYGFHNHNVDIIFMIGIKANYFWKLLWLFNPIFLIIILFAKWLDLHDFPFYDDDGEYLSYHIKSLKMGIDWLLLIIILSVYFIIIFVGLITQLVIYYHHGKLHSILSPVRNWGPKDKILSKSRKMFVPEIMTSEFLYRQVRIRGYGSGPKDKRQMNHTKRLDTQEMFEEMNWSVLTSN